MEASVYHNSRLVSTGALDVMTTQRDVIYTAKAETRVKLHKKDKASLGITVARLVEEGGPPTKVKSQLYSADRAMWSAIAAYRVAPFRDCLRLLSPRSILFI